jgi:hypothetical protein
VPPETGIDQRFLKESGYRRAGRNAAAEPNWDQFANDIAGAFENIQSNDVRDAASYLVAEPPYRQMIVNNGLSWQPLTFPNGSHAVSQALLAIRTVRNNLFHGGKHTPHSPPGRDEKLVRSALLVLNFCLKQNVNVRADYETSDF